MSSKPNSIPLASIVIVSWNARKYLEECLSSLRGTTDVPIETIVVDNASSDGSPEMVREQFPEVMLIQTGDNLGFARGNNAGIAHSRGKYLCLINSDVNVPSDCLGKLIRYMEEHPEVGVAGPQMLSSRGEVRRSTMRFPTVGNSLCRALALDVAFPGSRWMKSYLVSDAAHQTTHQAEILNGWFWVIRRDALEQVGTLDERFFMYGEDMDWCYRFHRAGWKLVFYADAAAVHYGGSSSANAPSRFYIEKNRANFQYWKKHHGLIARLANYLIVGMHESLRAAAHVLMCVAGGRRSKEAAAKLRWNLALLGWMMRLKIPRFAQASPTQAVANPPKP